MLSKLMDRSEGSPGQFGYDAISFNVRQALPEPTDSVYNVRRLAQEAKQMMGSSVYVRDKLRRELSGEQSAHKIARSIQALRIRYCIGIPSVTPVAPTIAIATNSR